jgi:hypothetical protein
MCVSVVAINFLVGVTFQSSLFHFMQVINNNPAAPTASQRLESLLALCQRVRERQRAFVVLFGAPPLVRCPAVPLPFSGGDARFDDDDEDVMPPLEPVPAVPDQAWEHKMF